jgi:hypothetical protein
MTGNDPNAPVANGKLSVDVDVDPPVDRHSTHLVDQRCDRTGLSPTSSIAPDRSRLTPVGNSIGTLAR